jgi:transcriptional regulator with PAS, ATPase and Fis domain
VKKQQTLSGRIRTPATNRDLTSAVAEGEFRQDLFYCLNVFPIRLPALRERISDTSLLVGYLIDRYAKKLGKKIRNIDKKTVELFHAYDWPGNIRELQNVVERAVILSEGETFFVDETWLTHVTPKPAASCLATKMTEERRGQRGFDLFQGIACDSPSRAIRTCKSPFQIHTPCFSPGERSLAERLRLRSTPPATELSCCDQPSK